jgi:hypothetical protein
MITNGFVPNVLKPISKTYYIEISIMGKKYYIVSLTEDLEDNVMLIYPKSKYTLEAAVSDFEDHMDEYYNN